jgi:hypothetical protein
MRSEHTVVENSGGHDAVAELGRSEEVDSPRPKSFSAAMLGHIARIEQIGARIRGGGPAAAVQSS